jgi:hypothetical protein
MPASLQILWPAGQSGCRLSCAQPHAGRGNRGLRPPRCANSPGRGKAWSLARSTQQRPAKPSRRPVRSSWTARSGRRMGHLPNGPQTNNKEQMDLLKGSATCARSVKCALVPKPAIAPNRAVESENNSIRYDVGEGLSGRTNAAPSSRHRSGRALPLPVPCPHAPGHRSGTQSPAGNTFRRADRTPSAINANACARSCRTPRPSLPGGSDNGRD